MLGTSAVFTLQAVSAAEGRGGAGRDGRGTLTEPNARCRLPVFPICRALSRPGYLCTPPQLPHPTPNTSRRPVPPPLPASPFTS